MYEDQLANRPSRILIVSINFAPEMIGCGKYTSELACHLRTKGHEVYVVTAPPHYPGWWVPAPYSSSAYTFETLEGVSVVRCPMLMRKNAGGLWRLLAPLSFALSAVPMIVWRSIRNRPDVVLVVEPTMLAAPAALFLSRLVRARAVLHVQDLEFDAAFAVGHLKGKWFQIIGAQIESFLLNRFDLVITISNKMRAALEAKCRSDRSIIIVRNWVELASFKASGKNEYRKELGILMSQFVVLYSGHIGPKQALHHLVAAAAMLEKNPRIVFVIAGEGPSKEKLVAQADKLRNVMFVPLQPPERVAEFLSFPDLHALPQDAAAADLVLPSKLGPMLASGKPVVAMADDGTELFDMLSGVAFVVPAGDTLGLAAMILQAAGGEMPDLSTKAQSLALSLDARELLPKFEKALLGA